MFEVEAPPGPPLLPACGAVPAREPDLPAVTGAIAYLESCARRKQVAAWSLTMPTACMKA